MTFHKRHLPTVDCKHLPTVDSKFHKRFISGIPQDRHPNSQPTSWYQGESSHYVDASSQPPNPLAGFPAKEEGPYFEIAASRQNLAVLTRSWVRYSPLPQNEFTRDAIRATGAQISGLDTVASQHNSRGLQWRNLVSSRANVFC